MNDITIPRLAFSVPDACQALSISRQTLYDLIGSGRLRSYKEGKRRFISQAAMLAYIADRERQQGDSAQ